MNWLYVQAVVVNKDAAHGQPSAISFRSQRVRAISAEGAYTAGQRWADRFAYSPKTETVNDYVVCLDGAEPTRDDDGDVFRGTEAAAYAREQQDDARGLK